MNPVPALRTPTRSRLASTSVGLILVVVALLSAAPPKVASGQNLDLLRGTRDIAPWQNTPNSNDPNLYTEMRAQGTIPATVSGFSGRELVVSLRDAGRPQQTCTSDSPNSGCVVLDYSPIVATDVTQFDLTVTVDTTAGRQTYFLWRDFTLRSVRDQVPI